MVSDSQSRAQKKYDQAKTKSFGLKLVKATDADVIEWLEKQDNRQGAIKQLIRDQIAREKGE